MLNNKHKERYLKLINVLGIEIGDKIKIPGWFTYEVKENGFYHNEDGWGKKYCNCFDLIVERGFEKIIE